MQLNQILKVAVRDGASDVILEVGSRPRFRFNGELVPLSDGEKITAETMQSWLEQVLPKDLQQHYEDRGDVDLSYATPKTKSRFRVNVFRGLGFPGMVFRVIASHIKSLEELQLPSVVQNFSTLKRGLVLVTGATGSGKSTTLAALVNRINKERPAHIITIEDPVEYTFQDEMATINQREVGPDAKSFAAALRSALRQNPDVILVGELRDKETIETALMAAETGHLVLATLHTSDAIESLSRLQSHFEQALAPSALPVGMPMLPFFQVPPRWCAMRQNRGPKSKSILPPP